MNMDEIINQMNCGDLSGLRNFIDTHLERGEYNTVNIFDSEISDSEIESE